MSGSVADHFNESTPCLLQLETVCCVAPPSCTASLIIPLAVILPICRSGKAQDEGCKQVLPVAARPAKVNERKHSESQTVRNPNKATLTSQVGTSNGSNPAIHALAKGSSVSAWPSRLNRAQDSVESVEQQGGIRNPGALRAICHC